MMLSSQVVGAAVSRIDSIEAGITRVGVVSASESAGLGAATTAVAKRRAERVLYCILYDGRKDRILGFVEEFGRLKGGCEKKKFG